MEPGTETGRFPVIQRRESGAGSQAAGEPPIFRSVRASSSIQYRIGGPMRTSRARLRLAATIPRSEAIGQDCCCVGRKFIVRNPYATSREIGWCHSYCCCQ